MQYIAGRKDRGDIEICYEPKPTKHGLKIQLTTSVERLYGNAIKKEIARAFRELGVKSGKVVAIDDGALPYVIQARVEAAVRLSR